MSAVPGSEAAVVAFGAFVLDARRRMLTRDGEPVPITPKAFDLLVALVERHGSVVSKDALMALLWPDTVVEEGNLAFQVSTLRKVLGAEGGQYVATVPGRGYQFVAPLRRLDEPVASETIVEHEDRATITVSESARPIWPWAAVLALVVLGVAGALLLRREPAPPPSPTIRSLAVLPFKPIVAAQRDEALELGIADTLITRLSRVPGVIVRPTSAVRRYTKIDDDPLAAGRELGVDAVVDGSIHRAGDRVRVTVRLLRTRDGHPVWATQMDERARDLFDVQDIVADNVARAVVPTLSPRVQAQLAQQMTEDAEAYELYLKGRYRVQQYDFAAAVDLFRRAIERDPQFAAAWAASAEAWLLRGRFIDRSPREMFDNARAAAQKAVALDPNLAEGHAALGQVYSDHDWDWDRAEREYQRALALNPNSDVAHAQYAYLLLLRRDFDRAIDHAQRATEIDPLSPAWATTKGFVLACAGRYDRAIPHLEEALRVHPRFPGLHLHLALANINYGRPEIGVRIFERALQTWPENWQFVALQAWGLARAGRREEALRIVRDLERLGARGEPVPPMNLALAWTALGDHDRAFQWLERAYADRLFLLRTLVVNPGFEPLRSDPRYRDLVRRLGL